jgi:tetratricopeptide (TPR) repeat protein
LSFPPLVNTVRFVASAEDDLYIGGTPVASANAVRRLTFVLKVGLMVLITVAAYLPALRAGFVFDDGTLILKNPILKADNGLYRLWFTTEASDYYPLTGSLLWFEWRLWGDHPAGYHLVNVALHAGNAVLVWLILRRLRIRCAWVAGALFAVHPVNVATVAWVSEQKSTLSMLLYALSILWYLRFDEEDGWRWYGLSLVAFLLALLSKTAVVMLPFVLLGCAWWRRGRLRRKDLWRAGPYVVLGLALGLTTIWFQQNRALGGNTVRTDGFLPRLAAAGWVPWFYLAKVLLPLNLVVVYPKWQIDASRWLSYVPGIILVACFALFWRKRESWGRPCLFGFGYFVVTLFPVLGFFDQGFYHYSLVADHWQYFSMVGVIALAVAAVDEIGRRAGERCRYLGTATGTAVLVALAVATWSRSTVYANNETLWRDNLAKNPNAYVAHENLGVALVAAGQPDAGMKEFQQALRIAPDEPSVHNSLAALLADRGRTQEAMAHYKEALRLRPNYPDAHCGLGFLLASQGRISEAVAHYKEALRLNPWHADTCNNFAWLLATREESTPEDRAWAVQLALRAVQSVGQQAPDLDTLAAAYAATGRFGEADAYAQEAVKLARATGQTALADQIEARARLYRNGKAYREPVHQPDHAVTGPALVR